MSSGSFENNITYKWFVYKSCMCEQDLALIDAQGSICHKPQPNQTKIILKSIK